MRVTVTYDSVKHRAVRKGNCTRCGRRTTRSQTFTRTINPFNTTGEGDERRPKTYEEVLNDVRLAAQSWDPAPEFFDHLNPCERSSS